MIGESDVPKVRVQFTGGFFPVVSSFPVWQLMINELAPCISSRDALTKIESADAMCLCVHRRSTVATCQWKMKKFVMGLRGFANSLEAIEEGPQHGLRPRRASNLRGVKVFQLSLRTGRKGTAASCRYAARLLWAGY